MKRKIYEDYEPISNIGVCFSLLTVLAVSTYLGVFSNTIKKSEKEEPKPAQVIQKADKTQILNYQYKKEQKERLN